MTIAFLAFVIAACIVCAVYCEWTICAPDRQQSQRLPDGK